MGVKRAWRLKRESDVQRVWQQGNSFAHPLIVVRSRQNEWAQSRVAFVVSKKVGNAVARNRAKRLLREATRQKFLRLAPGFDILLIARPALPDASLAEISAALEQLFTRARLWKSE